MARGNERIQNLEDKLESLVDRHEEFSREIKQIYQEIQLLKSTDRTQAEPEKDPDVKTNIAETARNPKNAIKEIREQEEIPKNPSKLETDLEKFIGENLINKIGIAILVIGVAIGAQYVIENELISPLTRIILGYLMGAGLLGFAIKLKEGYENFSAVLLSGSMAIMYFITFAAYSFYGLLPQSLTFAFMVLFTAFTAFAAIRYDRQVIAHFGLVGAYAVPFLLSDGSDEAATFFSYVSIINIGILFIAFKKYWKPLYYVSFLVTWQMYFQWYFSAYTSADFYLAFTFGAIFFIIFYSTFLAYLLIQKTKFKDIDVVFLLANAFLLYGLGYGLLASHASGYQLLGIFTLGNAVIHFVVGLFIYHKAEAANKLLYLVGGLVLVFITLAVPVQLDGNWVTLLWTGEATLLFWIGKTKDIPMFEKLSYPLMVLALFSILQDWQFAYSQYIPREPETRITPFFNIYFLTSLIFAGCFGFINKLNTNPDFTSVLQAKENLLNFATYSIAGVFLFSLYYSFEVEIANYWNQRFADSFILASSSGQSALQNEDLPRFKMICILNYSLMFLTTLSFVNIKKIKNRTLGQINLGLNVLCIAIFLIGGLSVLGELRTNYLNQTLAEYYERGMFHIVLRYISYGFVGMLILACKKYSEQQFLKADLSTAFDLLLHTVILWILSSELVNWMDIAGSSNLYKLGLSILWGTYSLFLIVMGIKNEKKYLRIAAIALFAITLAKVFFYDIVNLGTISKTIIFVTLGILLLIISFLYNKYKDLISDEVES